MKISPGFEDKQHGRTLEREESRVEGRRDGLGRGLGYFHEKGFNISILKYNVSYRLPPNE